MERLNGISRISPQNCGQLNGQGSCEGCPVYSTAQAIVAESGPDDAPRVLGASKLTSQCPEGARIDAKGLGIKLSPIRCAALDHRSLERRPYFVR